MAVPAGPAAIEGGALAALTGALILSVIAWASLYGLQQFYTYTFGAVIGGLARLIDKAVPFYNLGSATIGKLDRGVQESIGAALTQAERNVARTWNGLSWVARETGKTMELFAHATVEAIHSLTHGEIPAQVRASTVPVQVKQALSVITLSLALLKLRATLYAQVRSFEADLSRTFGLAHRGIDAIRRTDLPGIRAQVATGAQAIGRLERYAHGSLSRRIGKLEKVTAGAALAGGVLAVIARYAPWVRCSNVGRLGRGVCRTDRNLLDALLAGSLLIIGAISLAQMARELREPTALVMKGLEGFVRELDRLG